MTTEKMLQLNTSHKKRMQEQKKHGRNNAFLSRAFKWPSY